MSKYLKIAFSLLLVAYLVITLSVTASEKDDALCSGVEIVVEADGGNSGFVTASELAQELDSFPSRAKGTALANINTQEIRRHLLSMDKIEDATVVRYTDGRIRIAVRPIEPAIRVFDEGESYYVNRQGKRVKATARYHKNVPIIEGHFEIDDTAFTPLSLLPLVDYISADTVWNSFITMIQVKSPREVILIPAIREHVINLGEPSNLANKFERLRRFYSEVLSSQGWEKYDTLSLKWDGQLVATKRHRKVAEVDIAQFEEDEAVDTGTMLAGDDVAPGQTLPGKEANSEKPIPAVAKKQEQTAAPKPQPANP